MHHDCSRIERRFHAAFRDAGPHQGIGKIKESPAQLDAARRAAEKAGGKILSWFLTMGQYDAVIVSEFPNDEVAAKFMLSVGAMGNISTETLKAFNEAEYRSIIGGIS